MSAARKVDSLMGAIKGLSKTQQSILVDQIMNMLAEMGCGKKSAVSELLGNTSSEKPDCPHCGAKASVGYIVKHGYKNNAQRYFCKACSRHFSLATNTAFARTRKDADTWKKFIKMTITGKSLHECADECGIAYQTAFTWRHKVLNVFSVNQESTQMTGNIEIDEMLVPLSYKGNHVQGGFGTRKKGPNAFNDMPRVGYKRGTDNKSMSSKDKACVFCMIQDGTKGFYAAVPGVGFMNNTMLDATVKKHVDKESAQILSDNAQLTRNYLESNGYTYMILASNTSDNPHDHKPEIRDGLHIQHVNAMHRHIRKFLASYCGVSSKYLSNYISLYIWLRSVKAAKIRKPVEQVSVSRAASPDCYITGRQLVSRPAVPMCA